VIQAGHWRWRPHERVQVCSAQTLEKRGFLDQADLLVVDEAHCVRKQTAALIKNHADLKVLGLSATPFTKGSGELYTNIVNVTTTDKLVAEGHLVPVKMYAAKAIDMAGAKVVAGEWADRDIEERGLKIIGDVVGEWIDKTTKHYGGPVKTIVFSATVDHGEELCKQFNAAGFNFQQISYKDANDDRVAS
jgi:DNA repair protein RadD